MSDEDDGLVRTRSGRTVMGGTVHPLVYGPVDSRRYGRSLGVNLLQGHPLSVHQIALPEAVHPDQFAGACFPHFRQVHLALIVLLRPTESDKSP